MLSRTTAFFGRMAMGFLVAFIASGCQNAAVPVAPGMVQIQGEITVDGSPVPVGRVVYIPKQKSETIPGGEFASAVTNGKYRLELSPGAYRVEVYQFGESVKEEIPQLLPEKFNTESTLSADVSGDAPKQIDFALQSNAK